METKAYTEEVDLQQYWLVLKRRWLVIAGVFLATVGLSGFAVLLMQKVQYEADGMLLFQENRTSSLTGVSENIGRLETVRSGGNPLDTQAMILKSQPILKEVIGSLRLKDKEGKSLSPDALLIDVKPVLGTDMLEVSYTADNPELAAAVVNKVMDAYVKNNIESNREQVTAAGDYIQKQLREAAAELENAAEALRRFKTQNKTIKLQQESEEAVKNVSSLDQEINLAQAALAEVSAQQAQISAQLNMASDKAVTVTSLNQISGVQEVLGELQKVQTEMATQLGVKTEQHPDIIKLKSQESFLKSLLDERVKQSLGSQQKFSPEEFQIGEIKQTLTAQLVQLKAQSQGLAKKIQALSNLQAEYKKQMNTIPNLEKRQGDLERRLSVAQNNYQNLITRQQEIQVAERQTVGNAKVIQPAVVEKQPVVTKRTIVLLAGGVFVGALLGVAAAFFVDLIDRSVKTVKEAEALFGSTLLGLIPKFEINNTSVVEKAIEGISPRVIVATSPRSVVHEAYQMLQANLKFISHKKVRTIVITSSVSGEGKSEVSANLAAVLAQAGRRVLLVDADMRQPNQHHLWNLINIEGLSNVIVGQDEFSQVVQKVTKNISVLTAGVQPPNPLALIDSERMTSLIDMFSETYDHIIFDTPPLIGTADAAVLGKMVDGVLLVVRPGVVDSASANAAKSLLMRSEANILGIVANGVNVKHEPDSYFYYSNPRSGQGFAANEIGTVR
jgi:succinoglycan biosynthesis transport protein ExoP